MAWLRDPAKLLYRIAHARSSLLALFLFAFLEGAILPVPIEAVIVPFMQMRRDILWRIASTALAGFFASSMLGYGIGALFYDQLGAPMIAFFDLRAQFSEAVAFMAAYGFWAVLALGFTPLPTQILMIGAGAFGIPLLVFVVAVLLARGTRNFGAAALVYQFGDSVVRYFAPDHRASDEDQTPPR